MPTLLAAHAAAHDNAGRADEPLVVIGAPLPVRGAGDGFHHVSIWGWWERQLERMSRPGHRFSYGDVFSGVMSMQAALFTAVGGFDARLTNCRDDAELGARLIGSGARIVLSRAAGGFHHDVRNRQRWLARKRAEGRADVLLARRHPDLWPTLKLASREAPTVRFARWAALSAPFISRGILRALRPTMDLLEWLRFRGFWRMLHAASADVSYWIGAGDKLRQDGRSARKGLDTLAAQHAANPVTGLVEIELDLQHGLAAGAQRLDAERPHGVVLRFGELELGRIAPVPGAERLRGAHLRRYLGSDLAGALRSALGPGTIGPNEGRARIPSASDD